MSIFIRTAIFVVLVKIAVFIGKESPVFAIPPEELSHHRTQCIERVKNYVFGAQFIGESFQLTTEFFTVFEGFRSCIVNHFNGETHFVEAAEYPDFRSLVKDAVAKQLLAAKVGGAPYPLLTSDSELIDNCIAKIRQFDDEKRAIVNHRAVQFKTEEGLTSFNPLDPGNPWRHTAIDTKPSPTNYISRVYSQKPRFEAAIGAAKNTHTVDYYWKNANLNRFQSISENLISNYIEKRFKSKSVHTAVTPVNDLSAAGTIRRNFEPCAPGHFPLVVLGSVLQLLEQQFSLDRPWKIIDPSAGWGDRLTSALALGAEKVSYYIGIDPFETLQQSVYPKIIEELARRRPVTQTAVAGLVQMGSEVMEYGVDERGDRRIPFYTKENKITFSGHENRPNLIFTSPPYFDLETYGITPTEGTKVKRRGTTVVCETSQSIAKYSTFEEWIEGFLKKTVEKHFEILEEGGFLAYVLSDSKGRSITREFNRIMSQIPGAEYVGTIGMGLNQIGGRGAHGGKMNCEPIWVWRKTPIIPSAMKPELPDSEFTVDGEFILDPKFTLEDFFRKQDRDAGDFAFDAKRPRK